jgi:hypothetical protein
MRKVAASLTVLFVLWAVPSFAQRTTASIRGTVTDSSGGVIPGADVKVKGEDTGLTQTTVTNAAGVYSFAFTSSSSTRPMASRMRARPDASPLSHASMPCW